MHYHSTKRKMIRKKRKSKIIKIYKIMKGLKIKLSSKSNHQKEPGTIIPIKWPFAERLLIQLSQSFRSMEVLK
jgi:hypothetical protein